MLKIALAAAAALAVASPALATGKYTCNTPKASWKTTEALTQHLVKQGWQVRKAKVDGGCYEVYGTTPEGDRVEAYFDPASFEKLYVARRGEVLFKKGS
jgi:hypothetical protein